MTGESTAADDRPALSRLVGDVKAFAGEHWGELPLLRATPGFEDLLAPGSVDELVTVRGLRTPFLRMARAGTVLSPATYTAGAGVGARVSDQADSARITAEMAQGATLVLQALHRIWPPVATFTTQLQRDIGHPAQCNAYVTPPEARGFDAHYDTHDVFVLQAHGTKHWRLHRPVVEHPRTDEPWETHRGRVAEQAHTEPFLTVTLTPGDCLYIPRGWLHSATTTDQTSIHLTVGVHAATAAEVVGSAIRRLVHDHVELRRNLPLGSADEPAALIDMCAQILKEVQTAIGDIDANSVAAAVATDIRRDQTPSGVAPLRQLATLDDLTKDTRVRLRDGLQPVVEAAGDRVRLTAAGRFVEAPAHCAPALSQLTDGRSHSAKSLHAVQDRAAIALVRQALRQGIVIPVD